MNCKEILERAEANRLRALDVLAQSGIAEYWRAAGCRVSLVGSLRMGLLANHRDIDLHVYSSNISTEFSFGIAAAIAKDSRITELKCINGLHTEEHCIAWHFLYRADDGELWQFDVIHIEEGTEYDGFFERMAERIVATMTPEQRELILKLKFECQAECDFHGVEFYEAVIADGVRTTDELKHWVAEHRKKAPYYWMP